MTVHFMGAGPGAPKSDQPRILRRNCVWIPAKRLHHAVPAVPLQIVGKCRLHRPEGRAKCNRRKNQ